MPKFVIQKHHAKRAGLHYDFRLERNGTLKSWVLKKGVPRSASERRLAIQEKDHPLSWASFEGTIKEGRGAGVVEIWDKGTYEPLKWTGKEIKVRLNGKKVKGTFVLVPFKDNWLMIKVKEKAGGSGMSYSAGEVYSADEPVPHNDVSVVINNKEWPIAKIVAGMGDKIVKQASAAGKKFTPGKAFYKQVIRNLKTKGFKFRSRVELGSNEAAEKVASKVGGRAEGSLVVIESNDPVDVVRRAKEAGKVSTPEPPAPPPVAPSRPRPSPPLPPVVPTPPSPPPVPAPPMQTPPMQPPPMPVPPLSPPPMQVPPMQPPPMPVPPLSPPPVQEPSPPSPPPSTPTPSMPKVDLPFDPDVPRRPSDSYTLSNTGFDPVPRKCFDPEIARMKRVQVMTSLVVDNDSAGIRSYTFLPLSETFTDIVPDPSAQVEQVFKGKWTTSLSSQDPVSLPMPGPNAVLLSVKTGSGVPVTVAVGDKTGIATVRTSDGSVSSDVIIYEVGLRTKLDKGYWNIDLLKNDHVKDFDGFPIEGGPMLRGLGPVFGDSCLEYVGIDTKNVGSMTVFDVVKSVFDAVSGWGCDIKVLDKYDDMMEGAMAEGVGACRHRATVGFAALAKIGVPVRYAVSECHAWIEVYSKFNGQWVAVDLGGCPVPGEEERVSGLEPKPIGKPKPPRQVARHDEFDLESRVREALLNGGIPEEDVDTLVRAYLKAIGI